MSADGAKARLVMLLAQKPPLHPSDGQGKAPVLLPPRQLHAVLLLFRV
jgi:hypothetical protein